MLFTVKERLMLLQALPQVGDLTTLRIVRKLREDLSFDEEEHKTFNFQTADKIVTWNPDADQTKEIEISKVARQTIVLCLEKLIDEEQLHEHMLSLCDKFPEVEE